MALGGEGRAGPPAAGSDSGKKRARERAPTAPAPPRGSTWPGRLKTWAANPTGPDWEAVTAPVGKINAQLSKAETEQLSGQSHPPASLGQRRGGRAAGRGPHTVRPTARGSTGSALRPDRAAPRTGRGWNGSPGAWGSTTRLGARPRTASAVDRATPASPAPGDEDRADTAAALLAGRWRAACPSDGEWQRGASPRRSGFGVWAPKLRL